MASLRWRSRGGFADKLHFDEMVVIIKGRKYWLWGAVDAEGYVLEAFFAKPSQQTGSTEIDAQVAQRSRLHAPCDGDRQT
jgi:hypothetical protein